MLAFSVIDGRRLAIGIVWRWWQKGSRPICGLYYCTIIPNFNSGMEFQEANLPSSYNFLITVPGVMIIVNNPKLILVVSLKM
jgi:hypothetical protein